MPILLVLVVTAAKNPAKYAADASKNFSNAVPGFGNALAQCFRKAEAVKWAVGGRCGTRNECFFERSGQEGLASTRLSGSIRAKSIPDGAVEITQVGITWRIQLRGLHHEFRPDRQRGMRALRD